MKTRIANVLEINIKENTWEPPEIPEKEMALSVSHDINAMQSNEFLHIFQTEPYIDSLYIFFDDNRNPLMIKRFAIHEGYTWDVESERFFHEHCIKGTHCGYSGGQIERIFEWCEKKHSEWHVQRYYTKGLRMVDHVYHCMKQNTAKEMLYKSGLDNLAADLDEMDEINLLSRKPSELYDGLSMKVLRSLNCAYGAVLLRKSETRAFLKELNMKFQDLFKDSLNDAQCQYLHMLIKGDLTIGETGRLFRSRKPDLKEYWTNSQFDCFVARERQKKKRYELINLLTTIDPLYVLSVIHMSDVDIYYYYLLCKRKEYDKAIRRANRKRDYDWQERDSKYLVRYPQTINDFCREAVYMQNCLLSYVQPVMHLDTTILFMRRAEDVNKPFITIEIYENELMQAYHKLNNDCTPEEAEWIRQYCKRHGILTGKFHFNRGEDQLF